MEDTKEVQVKTAAPIEREKAWSYTPLVDIYETKDDFTLLADVPGVDEKSIDITMEKNVLTIHGKIEALQFPGHELTCQEYGMADYRRSFMLSGDIDQNKIEASVKNGVLHLNLPKTEAMKVKKITVH